MGKKAWVVHGVVSCLLASGAVVAENEARVTANDLMNFKFDTSALTADDVRIAEELERGEELEMNDALKAGAQDAEEAADEIFPLFDPSRFEDAGSYLKFLGQSARLKIQYFQGAPSMGGKQFLMASQDGRLKHVFAISAGKGRSPVGTFGVHSMAWQHESTKYPGKALVNNQWYYNMDRMVKFTPLIGFHGTLLGAYPKLGTKDSHGCVRQARGEAETLYNLVRANGSSATIVGYAKGVDPQGVDLQAVAQYLMNDLTHIQKLIKNRQYGTPADLPPQPSGIGVAIQAEQSIGSPI